MRVVLFACLLGLVVAEEVAVKYHERVGIPMAARIKQQESMRISNGLASYRGEHPFMAGLVITLTTGQQSVCGGALVNHYKVLTTAQCWYDGYSQGRNVLVVLGTVRLFSGGTRVYATEILTHPYFNPRTMVNDIAMLTVPYISFDNYVKPILLPFGISNTFANLRAEIIGYGKRTAASIIDESSSLRDVFVSVLTNAQCQQVYGSIVTDDIICTSGAGGKGGCDGDYGGPLILRKYSGSLGQDLLIGLLSFTAAAGCDAGYPAGFIRITDHMNWINNSL